MREMRERERRRPERGVARENSLSVAGREESEAAIEGHEGCYYLILYLYLILSDLIFLYLIPPPSLSRSPDLKGSRFFASTQKKILFISRSVSDRVDTSILY